MDAKDIEEGWSRIIKPTYLENWPVELKALTVHQAGMELSQDDTVALGKLQVELWEYWNRWEMEPDDAHLRVHRLTEELDTLIRRVMSQAKSQGVFVRLGSRSPKDSFWWWHAPERKAERGSFWPVTSGEEAMRLFTETSERVNDDLLEAMSFDYRPWIWARAWEDILPFQEFRCFVKDGRLLGISQYEYKSFFPQLVKDRTLYTNAINVIVNKRIIPSLHIPDAVVDVYVKVAPRPSGNGRIASGRLLEINPYFDMTDPCMFTWDEVRALEKVEHPTVVKIKERP